MTRGELREELKQLEKRLEKRLENRLEKSLKKSLEESIEKSLERRLAHLATKAELEIWGGALLARIDSGEQRILTELARHVKAIQETLSTQISAIDEKDADLPARVSRLETAVFVPERR